MKVNPTGGVFMRKITVLTADVIGSRKAGLNQDTLTRSLNELAHPALLVPFAVSRGDEVQGIMSGWLSAPQLVRMLRWRCLPHKLRVGIGTGYYDGRLEADPWKLSGPAFFRARKALESIAASKDPATRVVTGEDGLDTLINSVWLLFDTLMSRWTPGQWEAVMTYEQAGTYAAAAKILGVAAQNVQKRCKAAHWQQIRQAEQGLSQAEGLLKSP
ncbi:MAG TPA: hypothetical protein DG577_03460 [Firmicutes bacterium]|jgi:hypothetical protein|nr:hypothetical protein [Bacillota bacterium]